MIDKNEDFLLITPLRVVAYPLEPALGPLSLYSFAVNNGFCGDLIDFNTIIDEDNFCDYEQIVRSTISNWVESNPEVKLIGISCLFSAIFTRVLDMAEMIKDIRPDIPVVIGGNHATIFYEEIIKNALSIDYVVLGEGEDQFLSLLRMLSDDVSHTSLTNGVAYRMEDGSVQVSPKNEYISDLNHLGVMRYEKVEFYKYHTPDMDSFYNPKKHNIICAMPFATSRACPYKCNFCSMYAVMGRKFRPKDNKMILEELKTLYHEHGIRYFRFVDDCSTFNKENSMELFNSIVSSDIDISFEFYNGLSVKTLDKELIDVLVEAGLLRGSLAIETGSESLRNNVMKKRLSNEKIYEIYDYFESKHPHIWLIGLFLVGMPEETVDTLEDTISMIGRMKNLWPVFNIIIPFPGTEVYEQCIRDDLFTVETKELWKTELSANPPTLELAKRNITTDWCAIKQKDLDHTFLVKPYDLTIDQLTEYYRKLLLLKEESWERIQKRKERAMQDWALKSV